MPELNCQSAPTSKDRRLPRTTDVPIMLHSVKYADQRGTTVQEIDVSGPCDVNGSPSALVDARARHQLIEDQM